MLEPSSKVSPQILEDDFIAAFSKMGIKHGASAKIHSFKQEPHETVRDCVNRLKQYIARSPDEEKSSQKRLISIFLEGLVNKTLHAHLYAKKHTSFNECCLDAMDYDDNFEVDSESSGKDKRNLFARALDSSSSATKEMNPEAIVEIVLKKMGQLYHPSYRPQQQYTRTTPVGPYVCGGCGGDHRTEDCKTFSTLVNNQPIKKYCQLCSWNYTHVTQDCNRIARMRMEQQAIYSGSQPRQIVANQERNLVPQEQARPVLGAQPPAPGTASFTYVDYEYPDIGMELARSQPYYIEESNPLVEPLIHISSEPNLSP